MVIDHVTMPTGYIDKLILLDVPSVATLHRAFQHTTVLDFVLLGLTITEMESSSLRNFMFNRYHHSRHASPPSSYASVVSLSDDDTIVDYLKARQSNHQRLGVSV